MLPTPRQVLMCMIGISALEHDTEFAIALLVAWDAMLRLPSDLIGMRTNSLVGPGASRPPRWALLLFPA